MSEKENYDDYTAADKASIEVDFSEDDIDQNVDKIVDVPDDEFETLFKSRVNKHKLEGKHSLSRDTIFNGRLNDDENSELEESTSNFEESRNIPDRAGDDDEYRHNIELCKEIHDILKSTTTIDFTQNRRKPTRDTFNLYFDNCVENLSDKFSRTEIFVELSYYFTDNMFNMFKLLNKKNVWSIMKELKQKGYLDDVGSISFI